MTLEHVTISALELPHHSVVEVRRYHQPVLGGFRQLGALGCEGKKSVSTLLLLLLLLLCTI